MQQFFGQRLTGRVQPEGRAVDMVIPFLFIPDGYVTRCVAENPPG
ncbi:hypothetical protein BOTU111921_04805 [Bordetella tumbae]